MVTEEVLRWLKGRDSEELAPGGAQPADPLYDANDRATSSLDRVSLTPKEQDVLLADLAAAYAVEFLQADHLPGFAT